MAPAAAPEELAIDGSRSIHAAVIRFAVTKSLVPALAPTSSLLVSSRAWLNNHDKLDLVTQL
jgi:hypothetical protein